MLDLNTIHTEPMELTDAELDAVAAGSGEQTQSGLVNVQAQEISVAVAANVLTNESTASASATS